MTTWINQNTGEGYPSKIELFQNWPNPFNPKTTITFNIPIPQHVTLEVFNTLGQKVATLVDKDMTAGDHEIEFNASHLSSGVYYYKITSGDFEDVKKMALIK